MSESYSLNSNFGFNVSKNNINSNIIKHAVNDIDETVGNLFDDMTSYVAKYEKVFNGEIESETNMFIRQAMIVGLNLRAEDKTKNNFDINI